MNTSLITIRKRCRKIRLQKGATNAE